MVLPGVSRSRRISFVEELICTLVEEGLEGITVSELDNLNKTIHKLMDSVVPISEESENEDKDKEKEEKPGGC